MRRRIEFLFVVFLPLLLGFLFSHLSFRFEASFVCAMFAFLFWFLALFLILSAGFKEVYIHESRRKAGTEPYWSAERCFVCVTPGFFQKRFAPQKSNIDAKNGHIFKESTFSKPSQRQYGPYAMTSYPCNFGGIRISENTQSS